MNTLVPETVNFKELVKNNNNKMSIKIQNKLVERLNNTFKEEEQRWYAANMYVYLNYHPTDDFPIDLDDVYGMIGFANKENAKRTLLNNFTIDVDYKVYEGGEAKLAHTKGRASLEKQHGGQNKEKVLLNSDTFKNLCMIARTPKGKEIRKYYLKLETVSNSLIKDAMDEQVRQSTIENKQELLIREYSKECSLIYIIKVKTIDEHRYIIKIGESRAGISGRYKEHKSNYPECVLLDCFLVNNSKRLEKFLHNKYSINRYKELENHKNENELFLIGEELTYQQILNTIKESIHTYDDTRYDTEENLKLQIELMKLQNQNLQLQIENLKNQKEVFIDYERIEQIVVKVVHKNKQQNITNNFNEILQTVGPRVQQINPENMQLVKIYENVSEVTTNLKIPRSSLTKAYKENTVYKGYRWNFVERDQDPTDVSNATPTKHLSKVYNLGYIAKMNVEKTEIINVYLDRKTASFLNGHESVAYLDNYVKNDKICGRFYYTLYDNIEENIRSTFLKEKSIKDVVLYKSGIGKYDNNGVLLEEFRSKYHCQQELKIGEKSLNKALLSGNSYNSFIYKHLEEKLFF